MGSPRARPLRERALPPPGPVALRAPLPPPVGGTGAQRPTGGIWAPHFGRCLRAGPSDWGPPGVTRRCLAGYFVISLKNLDNTWATCKREPTGQAPAADLSLY